VTCRGDTFPVVDSNARALDRLGTLLHQAVRDDAALHGLLPVQLQVLTYLAQANRFSDLPVAVAEYLGITRGTVSQTIALLERERLISKHDDEHHGRRIHLRLTAAGAKIVSAAWSNRLARSLADETNRSDAIKPQVERLISIMQHHNGQHSFGVCRTCVHHRSTGGKATCALLNEPLTKPQIEKICREWQSPA
jgi:MarR family transcriptional regulator, negative regulator of the multidrug operon emrRAB